MTASFGELVRERRIAAGLTRSELARKLGVHRTYVAQMEKPTYNPTFKMFWKIGKVLIPDWHVAATGRPCGEHNGRCERMPMPVIRAIRG